MKEISIAKIVARNRFFLAPMAGITDSAYRTIATEFGAGLTYTEMVSAKALTFGDKKSLSLLEIEQDHTPCIAQIFGNDPDVCAAGAAIVAESSKAVAIDINMGCPVHKIVSNGEGSALMKDPRRAEKIIKAVKAAVDLPVTVKFRRGYTLESENAVEFAKMAEGAGVSAICVHGRTRTAMYSGQSDMNTILKVKEVVNVPVIASGDIFSPEQAFLAMNQYGADSVMVARGALGNPFLFAQLLEYEETGQYNKPTEIDILNIMARHITLMCQRKGEQRGIPEGRKHMLWYLKGVSGSKPYKLRMSQLSTCQQVLELLEELKRSK